jgi:hypothetical protein
MPTGTKTARRNMENHPNTDRAAERPNSLIPIVLALAAIAALIGAGFLVLKMPAAAASASAKALSSPSNNSTSGAGSPASNSSGPAGQPATKSAGDRTALVPVDGVISLPVTTFDDGIARFYTVQVDGKTIPFFVLKGSDGSIRAAFDACDVCYPAKKGYRQEGDVMVCNNCGNRFPSVRINVETGGCNPVPLVETVQGGSVIIKVADLQGGARYF